MVFEIEENGTIFDLKRFTSPPPNFLNPNKDLNNEGDLFFIGLETDEKISCLIAGSIHVIIDFFYGYLNSK
jgi:hypothetical protein